MDVLLSLSGKGVYVCDCACMQVATAYQRVKRMMEECDLIVQDMRTYLAYYKERLDIAEAAILIPPLPPVPNRYLADFGQGRLSDFDMDSLKRGREALLRRSCIKYAKVIHHGHSVFSKYSSGPSDPDVFSQLDDDNLGACSQAGDEEDLADGLSDGEDGQ